MTATPRSSGDRPTRTPRTRAAGRCTTGRSSTASSTRISQRKMKPLVEIGFMPEALSSHPTPYRHFWKPGDNYNDIYTGWSYPPADYAKWGELVYQWVRHSVAEVRPARSGELVVGSLERAGHRLLARHARRVHEAVRLRGRRPQARVAHGAQSAVPKSPVRTARARSRSCATSSNTACAASTTPPAKRDRRSTS